MATKADAFAEFDPLLQGAATDESPWRSGAYIPQTDLLRQLLSLPVGRGEKQESGRTARAFDAWIAHELRRSGFPEDSVWPRNRQPRVLPEGLRLTEEALSNLAEELKLTEESRNGKRLQPSDLRRAIRTAVDSLPGYSSAYVLGDFYAKQIDVGLSSWRRGPEILISTKTMFSSYFNNLKNRHEEAIGEVSSLRRRHPMAAMGYALLLHKSVYDVEGAYALAHDILVRLRRESETFDATMLLVGDWDANVGEPVVESVEQPSDELSAHAFFEKIIDVTTARTPVTEHQEVRSRRWGGDLDALSIPDGDALDEE